MDFLSLAQGKDGSVTSPIIKITGYWGKTPILNGILHSLLNVLVAVCDAYAQRNIKMLIFGIGLYNSFACLKIVVCFAVLIVLCSLILECMDMVDL